ncbi:MAG: efflux RND transporter periplasmic adaptor subunit [Proteobacteria bacterium]|nr:efflux RND transporter periplasmic adaptor subunit [Pseudomonadota bacterium]MCH8336948.1 efflux RND transporter periplasmic adaptor subunit [Pseudomonadota bacterium]
MNKSYLAVAALVVVGTLSFIAGRQSAPSMESSTAGSGGTERKVLYWAAPMDPNYRSDEPGNSPMGMELVAVYADEVDGQPGVVKINPTIVNNLGVRTAVAEFGLLSRRIETVGYIGYDEDKLKHIHTRVAGWVEKLATKATGDRVEKGQLLFELYSPTLVNAQEEYLTALRSNNTLLLRASKDRLVALGVDVRQISRLDESRTVQQRVRVYAKADGVIARLGIREGNYVTPATEIMSVAELDKVWVLAEVFARQAAWVKAGQPAIVELDYLPGETWRGIVDYVYPELDPKTRTLKVRLRFDNATESLRPNMFARVTILADGQGEVIHVPREAVIRGGSVDRVVLALGAGRFRSQPVTLGIESGNRVAIRRGLSAGDRIVVSGQFLIDSESNIEAALAHMESPQ